MTGIRHILDVLDTSSRDEWVIAGTGPSFSTTAIEGLPFPRVLTLDDVASHLTADLALVLDWSAFGRLETKAVCHAKLFASPITQRITEPAVQKTLPFYTAIGLKLASVSDRITCFDLASSGTVHFPQKQPIADSAFGYEAALWILALKGVRRIYTTGIDTGSSVHPLFAEHAGPPKMRDSTFIHARIPETAFGLEITRL